jgi:hypothetical protein
MVFEEISDTVASVIRNAPGFGRWTPRRSRSATSWRGVHHSAGSNCRDLDATRTSTHAGVTPSC